MFTPLNNLPHPLPSLHPDHHLSLKRSRPPHHDPPLTLGVLIMAAIISGLTAAATLGAIDLVDRVASARLSNQPQVAGASDVAP